MPFRRHDGNDDANSTYYRLKHQLLTAGIASQFVSTEQLRSRNALKWSVSNIGLQLFAKMGGQPWKVEATDDDSLVVGVGQSKRPTTEGTERYIAYSILTDSSGLYKEMRILASSHRPSTASRLGDLPSYRQQIADGLGQILDDYGADYKRFVLHASFTIGARELRGLRQAVQRDGENPEIVILKFNAGNHYFGWDVVSNSMVPYSGSVLHLGRSEYLMWFAGLDPARPKAVSTDRAVHVRFLHPHSYADEDYRRELLRASFQLARANWRGFNARSLPVSVAYAHEVAKFLRGFAEAGLDEPPSFPGVPWFL